MSLVPKTVRSACWRAGLVAVALLAPAASAFADECLGEAGEKLALANPQVLDWKRTTPNQTHRRAYVSGKVVAVYRDRSGHDHFSIRLGTKPGETLEVIYNQSFGDLPELRIGDQVEACGDYITSNAPTDRYPASPDGAIIHWVHATAYGSHPSGFVKVNGKRYGDLPAGHRFGTRVERKDRKKAPGTSPAYARIQTVRYEDGPTALAGMEKCALHSELRELEILLNHLDQYKLQAKGQPWDKYPLFPLHLSMGKKRPLCDGVAQSLIRVGAPIVCKSSATDLFCQFGIHKSGPGRFSDVDRVGDAIRPAFDRAVGEAKRRCDPPKPAPHPAGRPRSAENAATGN